MCFVSYLHEALAMLVLVRNLNFCMEFKLPCIKFKFLQSEVTVQQRKSKKSAFLKVKVNINILGFIIGFKLVLKFRKYFIQYPQIQKAMKFIKGSFIREDWGRGQLI